MYGKVMITIDRLHNHMGSTQLWLLAHIRLKELIVSSFIEVIVWHRIKTMLTYHESIPTAVNHNSVNFSHYCDAIMGTVASQITSLMIVYTTVYSDADQSKHHSSASLAFVWGIHRGPVNSPHKWPVTRKMFPFDDVIMENTKYFFRDNVVKKKEWKMGIAFVIGFNDTCWWLCTGHMVVKCLIYSSDNSCKVTFFRDPLEIQYTLQWVLE